MNGICQTLSKQPEIEATTSHFSWSTHIMHITKRWYIRRLCSGDFTVLDSAYWHFDCGYLGRRECAPCALKPLHSKMKRHLYNKTSASSSSSATYVLLNTFNSCTDLTHNAPSDEFMIWGYTCCKTFSVQFTVIPSSSHPVIQFHLPLSLMLVYFNVLVGDHNCGSTWSGGHLMWRHLAHPKAFSSS